MIGRLAWLAAITAIAATTAHDVLGEPGDGLRIAMYTLNNGRMSLGIGVVGATKRLIKQAVDHSRTRDQFGRPLAEFELVEDKISWMVSYLYGFESMAYLTTGLVDAGVPDYSVESAMSKIAGTEFYWYAVNRVFQLLGGQAYMADSPLPRRCATAASFRSSKAPMTCYAPSSSWPA